MNHVWGDAGSGGTYSDWWQAQASGSGSSGGSSWADFASDGYDQYVDYTGFYGTQFTGPLSVLDGDLEWGEGWAARA